MTKLFFKDFQGIETERLILRKLTLNDVNDIFKFTSIPKTSEFLTWQPHESELNTDSFIKSVIDCYEKDNASQWAMHHKTDNKVIGITGFITYMPEHKKGEIAYVLSPEYWGKGYMPEALQAVIRYGFNQMDLIRIEAKCEINNFASERVMQKLGMKCEGCHYNYLIVKGSPRSFKFYCLLK